MHLEWHAMFAQWPELSSSIFALLFTVAEPTTLAGRLAEARRTSATDIGRYAIKVVQKKRNVHRTSTIALCSTESVLQSVLQSEQRVLLLGMACVPELAAQLSSGVHEKQITRNGRCRI